MNMTKAKDWADKRADAVVNSVGYREDPEAAIAVALRDVADECAGLADLVRALAPIVSPQSKGAEVVMNEIRTRFPRCHDGE